MRDLILGLARPMLRMLGREDRGAIAVLVGVLIGGGVLLGMGAMVLDVGQLYQERAELQNGAGAAALAVAGSCANGACDTGLATTYANKNASKLTNHQEKVDIVCGTGIGPCPTVSGAMTSCPNPPASAPNYVDVYTSTKTPTGLLPPVLGRALLGNGSYQGTDVGACAQAVWGPLGGGQGFGMAISLCAWQQLTGNGERQLIPLYIAGSGKTCASNPSGSNVAGGFGWLGTDDDIAVNGTPDDNSGDSDHDGDASNSCQAYIASLGTTYLASSDPGANTPPACQTEIFNDVNYNYNLYTSYPLAPDGLPPDGKTTPSPGPYSPPYSVKVFLPVFNNVVSNGNNAEYTIVYLAPFVLMGYAHMNFSIKGYPQANNSWGLHTLCNQPSLGKCIEGYFTGGLDSPGSVTQNNNPFGGTAVQLTG